MYLFKNLTFSFIFQKKYFYIFIILIAVSLLITAVEALSVLSLASLGSFLSNNTTFFKNFFNEEYEFSLSNILIITVASFVIKNLLLITYNFLKSKFHSQLYFILSTSLYNAFLSYSYSQNIEKKPEILIRKISSDVTSAVDYVFMLIDILKEIFILISILFLLYFYKTLYAMSAFLVFGIISFLFYKYFKKILNEISKKYLDGQTNLISLITLTFGSLKESHIYKNNTVLKKTFVNNALKIKKFLLYKNFITTLPRIIFEVMTITGIMVVIYVLSAMNFKEEFLLNQIILLSVTSIRLIPSFNNITSIMSNLKIYGVFFKKIEQDLRFFDKFLKNKGNIQLHKLKFDKDLNYKNIDFSYKDKKAIFDNSNFSIFRNKSIGILGASGSGKTTLVDLILGILNSVSKITINDRQVSYPFVFDDNIVGYVPQFPFLLNSSVRENIIFGRQRYKISKKMINSALKFSKIYDFVQQLPSKEQTIIGNSGSFLSGGQKQRIVIARAILLKPKILILDEATNALDSATEELIIKDILSMKQKITVILISHKYENIKKCDVIYKILNKKIIKITSN